MTFLQKVYTGTIQPSCHRLKAWTINQCMYMTVIQYGDITVWLLNFIGKDNDNNNHNNNNGGNLSSQCSGEKGKQIL